MSTNGTARYQEDKVRVAIIGVGNCASSFVQGVQYYKDADPAEQVPGLNITLWNGLFVPKGTPQEVKDKLAAIAEKAMQGDKAKAVATSTGAGVYWMGAADAAKRIEQDYADAEALVKDLKK